MNIFYLSDDPIIAANMHCDQHLGKMILESAQMLSTIALESLPIDSRMRRHFYKPTHSNHPCTDWLRASRYNQRWLMSLCSELDNIRASLGKSTHNSMEVLNAFNACFLHSTDLEFTGRMPGTPAIFCGPGIFSLNSNIPTVPEKYQAFYAYKAKRWALDGKQRMSYKGRVVPSFLSENEYVHS
jgi:hypothetical protein